MTPISILKAPAARPGMVLQRPKVQTMYPFSSPFVYYYYFARNAIWHTVRQLNLVGFEILAPAYHHGVEIEALIDAGAKIRFYRVDEQMHADVADIKRKINPHTRAIYLIHYLGFPGPIEAVQQLARRRGLTLIEDCALALLSADGERPLGGFGDASIFCLYKTLPVPHGGALAFNSYVFPPLPRRIPPSLDSTLSHFAVSLFLGNPEWKRMGRILHSWLQPAGKAVFSTVARLPRVDPGSTHFNRDHVNLGMSRLSGHLIHAQNLSEVVQRRRRNFLHLLDTLRDVSPPVFDRLPEGVCPLFYPIRVADKDLLMDRLQERQIETIDFWRHGHPACTAAEFPEVAALREHIVELPCHQDLTEEQIHHLADEVKDVLKISRLN